MARFDTHDHESPAPDGTARKILHAAQRLLRDPDLATYFAHRGETEQGLAAMSTDTLNRLHRGAKLAARRARTPADRIQADEVRYRVECALQEQVFPND